MNVVRTLLIAAAALLFALVPSAQATMANAVPNPGFEELGCGSSVSLEICAWDAGKGSSIARDQLKPHSGNASLALVGFSGSAEAMSDPADCVSIGPGRHAASFWYRTADAGFVGFSARFWTGGKCTGLGSSSELTTYPSTPDDQWRQVTGDMVAPPGTASVSYGLAISGASISGACDACSAVSADFDDLMVEAEPLPAPPADSTDK
jgi:hypothetical protein